MIVALVAAVVVAVASVWEIAARERVAEDRAERRLDEFVGDRACISHRLSNMRHGHL